MKSLYFISCILAVVKNMWGPYQLINCWLCKEISVLCSHDSLYASLPSINHVQISQCLLFWYVYFMCSTHRDISVGMDGRVVTFAYTHLIQSGVRTMQHRFTWCSILRKSNHWFFFLGGGGGICPYKTPEFLKSIRMINSDPVMHFFPQEDELISGNSCSNKQLSTCSYP
jgi:hypothetical protein